VSQNLGILQLHGGNLPAAVACFQYVIESSEILSAKVRGVRGLLGLSAAHLRMGLIREAKATASAAVGAATQLQLAREIALGREYLAGVAIFDGSWKEALISYSNVHRYAVSSRSPEMQLEVHRKLSEYWIELGNRHYASIHLHKGLRLSEQDSFSEDIYALQRCALEVRWLEGHGDEALKGLIAHANKVRAQGFGYEQLLTTRRIAVIAESLGKLDLAAEWWSRTEFLAEACGAEALLEHWRKQREDTVEQTPENQLPPVDLGAFGIITRCPKLRQQSSWIARLAPTTVPVLIQGESGTGKELFARLIHILSKRKDQPFLALNCAALPNELIESELFGYRRGAFTGAITDKIGLFREAHQGTLFLDEIGEMPPSAQAKLLRAIETGEMRPVGGTKPERVDVRIVSATNVNLRKAVEDGTFRKDLYFRLRGLELVLPPLRDRLSDIPALAEHFVAEFNVRLGKDIELPFETAQWLMTEPWPGNVRELRLVLEQAVALAPSEGPLLPSHFLRRGSRESHASLPNDLKQIEKERIRNALEVTEGSVTGAAQLLGMSRTTLSGRIRKLGIRKR
jgi:DNA-binding NtrC family response regulator